MAAFFRDGRGDGKELYYLSAMSSGQMMAVDINVNGSTLQAGAPHALFDSGYLNLNHPTNYHVFAVARDGQRFLIPRPDATPGPDDPNARTLTLFDRQGNAVGTVGDRGYYSNVQLSPDQTRVALLRADPVKGTTDVWVIDVAKGKGTQITSNKREDGTRTPGLVARRQADCPTSARDPGSIRSTRKHQAGKALRKSYTSSTERVSRFKSGRRTTSCINSQQLGGNIEFALPLTADPKPCRGRAVTVSNAGRPPVSRSSFHRLPIETNPEEIRSG
jgi:hypothetical protein